MTPAVPAGWRWRDGPVAPGPCVLVDIDGVLADASHRQHHLDRRPKDWEAFFATAGDDPPLVEGLTFVRVLDDALTVVLLTGRPARTGDATEAWLARHGARWDLLAMRGDADRRPASVFKAATVGDLARLDFRPVLAVDDDPPTVDAYREAGLPALLVWAEGDRRQGARAGAGRRQR